MCKEDLLKQLFLHQKSKNFQVLAKFDKDKLKLNIYNFFELGEN